MVSFRLPLCLDRVCCWYRSVHVRGGFVCLNIGSRLVLVFSFAFGVCLRSALVLRGVCGGFVSPRCWLVFGVGCGPSRVALILVVKGVQRFRIVFFLCSVSRVGRPMPKLGNFRCKLSVCK